MIRFKEGGEMEIVDGVEEINFICDVFKVPDEVRAEMIREEHEKTNVSDYR